MYWYLVKENWAAGSAKVPDYAGVGGDIWPLMDADADAHRELHRRVFEGRTPMSFECSVDMVVTSFDDAVAYFEACRASRARHSVQPGSLQLLRLSLPGSVEDTNYLGFDVGRTSGGYSLIESEVIVAGRATVLNQVGLFASVEEADHYLDGRTDPNLEELGTLQIIGVERLRWENGQ